MIISRTPLRISFFGGGTDFPEYYSISFGAVVSTTIQKYIYVCVKKRYEDTYRIGYIETEITPDISQIRHDIIREMLKFYEIKEPIEVITMADVPGHGTGLGSSSALAVGLSRALSAYQGVSGDYPQFHARVAYHIEHDVLNKPLGKQDQYASSYGGFNCIEFHSNESVKVNPIPISTKTLKELEQNLLCFDVGARAPQNIVLSKEKENIPNRMGILTAMRNQSIRMQDKLRSNDVSDFGEELHASWLLKKQLADNITTKHIDDLYALALASGAKGGKICGAGGGGFLLLYVPKEKQDSVCKTLTNFKKLPISFENEGCKVVYED